MLYVDRVLYSSVVYPANYGFLGQVCMLFNLAATAVTPSPSDLLR